MTVRAMVLERRGLALVTSRVACLFGFPPLGHPPYTNATPIYTTAASHPSRSSADKLTVPVSVRAAEASSCRHLNS